MATLLLLLPGGWCSWVVKIWFKYKTKTPREVYVALSIHSWITTLRLQRKFQVHFRWLGYAIHLISVSNKNSVERILGKRRVVGHDLKWLNSLSAPILIFWAGSFTVQYPWGSFALQCGHHLGSGIICGPVWGSFAHPHRLVLHWFVNFLKKKKDYNFAILRGKWRSSTSAITTATAETPTSTEYCTYIIQMLPF